MRAVDVTTQRVLDVLVQEKGLDAILNYLSEQHETKTLEWIEGCCMIDDNGTSLGPFEHDNLRIVWQ